MSNINLLQTGYAEPHVIVPRQTSALAAFMSHWGANSCAEFYNKLTRTAATNKKIYKDKNSY
jgi:hypothetical protein